MSIYLIYMMKVAILLALLYSGYRLLLAQETRHKIQRLVLLSSVVMAFSLPVIVITTTKDIWINTATHTDAVGESAPVFEENPSTLFRGIIPFVLITVYLAGVLTVVVRVLSSNWKVWQIIKQSQRHSMSDSAVLCVSVNDMAPFNWWRYIVVGAEDINNKAVLNHELGHVRHQHSLDILLLDIACILQWFNPFVWMLRRELCTVHEFEADEKVLAQGEDVHEYQMLLFRRAVKSRSMATANSLSQSALRQRIIMMQRHSSTRWNYLRLLYFVPIIALTLSVTAETIIHYHYPNIAKKKIEKNIVPADNDSHFIKPIVANSSKTGKRDLGTIHKNDTVLIVANGIEMSEDDLAKINPGDIESVTVLKGASMSLYKERVAELGATGVIIVKTHQGKGKETESNKSNDADTLSVISIHKINPITKK